MLINKKFQCKTEIFSYPSFLEYVFGCSKEPSHMFWLFLVKPCKPKVNDKISYDAEKKSYFVW